jgi:hypothetical protein
MEYWPLFQQIQYLFYIKIYLYCINLKLTMKHIRYINKKTVVFSPQAKYTDSTTATGRRILVPTFVGRGSLRDQRGGTPKAVNLSSLIGTATSSLK